MAAQGETAQPCQGAARPQGGRAGPAQTHTHDGMKLTARKRAQLLEAYRKAMCNVTLACKSLGVSRRTFYLWREADKALAAELDDIKDEARDFIENALYKRIEAGDTTAIIFACKTMLRDRGYVESQSHSVTVNSFEELMRRLPPPPGGGEDAAGTAKGEGGAHG